MTDLSIASSKPASEHKDFARKFALAAGLSAIGDWLFYERPIGISLAIFVALIAVAALVANPEHFDRRRLSRAFAFLAVGMLPMIVELNTLSFFFGAAGITLFSVIVAQDLRTTVIQTLTNSLLLVLNCGWRVFLDTRRAAKWWLAEERTRRRAGSLTGWIVPLTLGSVFLVLFADANPLIAGWLGSINFQALVADLSLGRILFWLLAISLTWPFVAPRLRIANATGKTAAAALADADPLSSTRIDRLLSRDAILRALVLFNLLFALQTTLDFLYLWGGVALPDGMTYAAYAHRGAYPLIATALLAAAFVIVALKPGSESERSPVIRALVFAWIGQNILLVASSILRLNLYVEVYLLTLWRFAAFVWMLLVALGLALIVARIVFRRSNHWLIAMNGAALVLALYMICFLNVPLIIANYNVEHSRELSGNGIPLDENYVVALGPQAIPALDRYIARRREEMPDIWKNPSPTSVSVLGKRNLLASAFRNRMKDWRAFSYRDWQLARYLQSSRPGIADSTELRPVAAPARSPPHRRADASADAR